MTPSWNLWDPAQHPVSSPWTNWDPTRAPITNTNSQGGDQQAPAFNLDDDWLKTVGFNGPSQFTPDANSQRGDQSAQTSPELMQWLKDKGYNLQLSSSDDKHGNKQLGRLVDAQGNQVGDGQQWGLVNDDAFGIAALAAGGFAGAAAAGAGAGAAGAANGSWDVAGTAGGGVGGGGGSALGMGAGYTVPEVGGAAAGGAAGAAGGGAGGLLGAGGVLGTGLSMGNIASLIGAGAGLLGSGKGGLNSATQTTQNTVDPRIAQYLYGADGNAGLLSNVAKLYDSQMATGGLNPLQQQGIAAQQAVLQNPNYAQGFNQMKQAGQGLLAAPIAGNPFMGGGNVNQGLNPQQAMQAGAQLVPGMNRQPIGLLGRQ